jgi:hypothetical protein
MVNCKRITQNILLTPITVYIYTYIYIYIYCVFSFNTLLSSATCFGNKCHHQAVLMFTNIKSKMNKIKTITYVAYN